MTFSGFDAVFFTVSFLVPGFVCSAVLSMLVPRRAVETQIRFLEFLTLSCINHGVWSWALFLIFKTGLVDREPAWTGLALLGIMFVSPIALGLVSAWLQQTAFVARFLNWFGFRTVHPTPSAWDYYFSQARPCWALVTLKDGSRVYGLYGFRSFAGSDPKDRDLYLEATYRLVETGDWAPVEDTAGILISADQIAAIEFRTLTEVTP